jgi:hypothetical protein
MADVAVSPPGVAAEQAPTRPDFQIVPLRGLPIVGAELVVLTLSLVVYAIHVPLLTGFTVARSQPLAAA